MLGNSGVTERLVASQEALGSMDLVQPSSNIETPLKSKVIPSGCFSEGSPFSHVLETYKPIRKVEESFMVEFNQSVRTPLTS
jgi:hypothetical protein